jgi:hypothetical protein
MTTPPSPLPFELPPVTIVSRQTGRVLVQFPSSPLGYKTVQVYEFLNRAAYPKVALLYSDDDKPAEIYYKPRLGGGEYSVAFVPSYGPHINPFQLIQNKVLFKNLKRENRRHDSQILAEQVGEELYRASPGAFATLAGRVIDGVDEGVTTPAFWGGVPRSEEQYQHLVRHYRPGGPGYRPPPSNIAPSKRVVKQLRERLSNAALAGGQQRADAAAALGVDVPRW